MDRGIGEGMQQNNLQQGTAPFNIKIAKTFPTTSNEALCILTDLTPVMMKAEDAAKFYNIMRNRKPTRSTKKYSRKTGFSQQTRLE
jgi:coproporphyrinogen III oxidase